MENVAVLVKDVTQMYGKTTILKNIDLKVEKGEIIGFLGPSGSGKTTLVKAIIGMIKPASGEIKILDTKIPSLKACENIGYMAQSDALYEDLSGMDNILFFASLYEIDKKKAKERAKELLAMVLLQDDGKKLVKNYSGGMKRRLSLAIALIHDPKLVILDEPTVGIDPLLRREFWKEFKKLNSQGTTLIITTHVMDEAENCDTLALIRDGKVIAKGSPEELKVNTGTKTLEEAFLYYSTDGGGK